MSFIKYEYININNYSRPGIRNNGIDGIVMHYTANNGGTARNHKNYFNNLKGIYASAQLFVDDIEALCIIPLNEVAYHANYSTIGVEMCLDKNGNITEKTFQNAVKAVKELIAIYPHITREKIWRHFDVTGKNCPAPWVAKPSEFERFKNAVFSNTSNNTQANTPQIQPKKVGETMLLFRNQNDPKVYFLTGNKFTHVKTEGDLKKIQAMMEKAGYGTWIHTDPVQVAYLRKVATEA